MKLAQQLGLPEDRRRFIGDDRFVLPECRLGVEEEWENTGAVARNQGLPALPWSHYWNWHQEGSLREGGSELVYAEPLFGRDAYDAIVGLAEFARANDWRATSRTGIHVHVDVRDLEIQQLVGFCTLYALFEKALYRFVGDQREDNHFCLPWYKAEGSVLQAAAVVNAGIRDQAENRVSENLAAASDGYARYTGLNMASLRKFGSAEFRQLKTTHDVQRIMNWINILLCLKRGAFRLPQSDRAILDIVENQGSRQLGRDTFGQYFELLDYPEFEDDVRNSGIPVAEELLREGLTVNLWEMHKRPQGEHKGFKKFLEKAYVPLAAAAPAMPQAAQDMQQQMDGRFGEQQQQAARRAMDQIFGRNPWHNLWIDEFANPEPMWAGVRVGNALNGQEQAQIDQQRFQQAGLQAQPVQQANERIVQAERLRQILDDARRDFDAAADFAPFDDLDQ